MIKKSHTYSVVITMRRLIYTVFSWVDGRISRWIQPRVIILCYHSISSDDWRFSVSRSAFEWQIDWLKERGYQFLRLSDIPEVLSGARTLKQPSVVLTFDDGYQDIISVKDWLTQQNIYPTAFVLSRPERASRSEVCPGKAFLSVTEINELRQSGWEIGSHSATHADFSRLTEEQFQLEIVHSRDTLEQVTQNTIEAFAYPKGFHTPKIVSVVKSAGYSLGVTMDDGGVHRALSPFLLPRIGVDRTHTEGDFRGMISVPAIWFRSCLKAVIPQQVINQMLGIHSGKAS